MPTRFTLQSQTVAVLKVRKGTAAAEAKVLLGLGRHPHLVRFLGLCNDGPDQLMVTEYAALGALDKLIERLDEEEDETIPFKHKHVMINQITSGMQAIAEKKMNHRDLTTRNILVFAFDAADVSKTLVKVSDFGLPVNVHTQTKASKPIRHLAPESLQKGIYSEKSDVWSFGVLAWTLLTDGNKPYYMLPEDAAVIAHVLGGGRLGQPNTYECPDKGLWEAVESCWLVPKKYRPSFGQLSVLLGQRDLSPQSAAAAASAGGGSSGGATPPATADPAETAPASTSTQEWEADTLRSYQASPADSGIGIEDQMFQDLTAFSGQFNVGFGTATDITVAPPSPGRRQSPSLSQALDRPMHGSKSQRTPVTGPCLPSPVRQQALQNVFERQQLARQQLAQQQQQQQQVLQRQAVQITSTTVQPAAAGVDVGTPSHLPEGNPAVESYCTVDSANIGAAAAATLAATPNTIDVYSGPPAADQSTHDDVAGAHATSDAADGGTRSERRWRRVDPTDGNLYTKDEFYDCYNGLAEWDAAGANWTCSDSACLNDNFRKRTHCNACGLRRGRECKPRIRTSEPSSSSTRSGYKPALRTVPKETIPPQKKAAKKKKKKKQQDVEQFLQPTGKDIKALLKQHNWEPVKGKQQGTGSVYALVRDGMTFKTKINWVDLKDSRCREAMAIRKFKELQEKSGIIK